MNLFTSLVLWLSSFDVYSTTSYSGNSHQMGQLGWGNSKTYQLWLYSAISLDTQNFILVTSCWEKNMCTGSSLPSLLYIWPSLLKSILCWISIGNRSASLLHKWMSKLKKRCQLPLFANTSNFYQWFFEVSWLALGWGISHCNREGKHTTLHFALDLYTNPTVLPSFLFPCLLLVQLAKKFVEETRLMSKWTKVCSIIF